MGEITWEEIDLGQAGADYGWNVREGFCATGSTTDCGAPPAGMTNPLHAYSHEPSGCYAITGGAFVPEGHLVRLLRRRLPLRGPGVRKDLPDVAPGRRRL